MSLFGSKLKFAANTNTFDSDNTTRLYGEVQFDDEIVMNNASESAGDMGYVTIIGSLTGTYIIGLYRENDDKDVYHLVYCPYD